MKRMVGIAVGLAVLLGLLVVPEGRAASQTLLSASSTGKPAKLKTRAFTVAGAWQVQWQYTCPKASGADFHIAVFTAAGGRAGFADVHLRSKTKRGTQRYQVGGSFYLLVHSPCSWRVSVLGTKPASPPAPTRIPPLADVKGTNTNLNDFLVLGIVLGQSHFYGFSDAGQTFLAPAHFTVDWSVSCEQGSGGTGADFHLAMFYVVGYDGKYQPEELYTAYDQRTKSGATNIDTNGEKRWAFMVSDADKQQCSYHLVAKRL